MDGSVLVDGDYGRVEAPSVVYLIEGAETILVDTGYGDVGRMAGRHPDYDFHRGPDQSLRAVLDDEGYVPGDLDRVVLSHLDWDHCHTLALFDEAGIEIDVQRRELTYAAAPYPMHEARYEADDPPWQGVDLTPLDGETELCSGVTAVPTPGHTVGHQSLAVETEAGTTVVAADAVPTFRNLSPIRLGLAMDHFDWWESATRVVERADRILPGHEWAVVDASPAGLV
jgi:glyoxylase-like metal-dependent hydrolase (beta-lactamase superfamily II)